MFTPTLAILTNKPSQIDFPLVPVSGAIDYTSGNVLVWSSWAASTFAASAGKNTLTATYNITSGIVSQRNVSNTDVWLIPNLLFFRNTPLLESQDMCLYYQICSAFDFNAQHLSCCLFPIGGQKY